MQPPKLLSMEPTYFKEPGDFQDSERQSFSSSYTENYSTLTESNAVILENLDGTFYKGKIIMF